MKLQVWTLQRNYTVWVRSSPGQAWARLTMFVVPIVSLTDGCIYRAWPHILLVGNLKTKTWSGKNQTQTWFMILPHMSQYYLFTSGETVWLITIRTVLMSCSCSSVQAPKNIQYLTWSPRKCKQTMLLEWVSRVSRVLLNPGWNRFRLFVISRFFIFVDLILKVLWMAKTLN